MEMTNTADLENRIKKRLKHLRKWAKREGVSYFRFYNRDLPNFPLICDWVDGEVVVWEFSKSEDENSAERTLQLKNAIADAVGVDSEKVYVKDRYIQKGKGQYEKRQTESNDHPNSRARSAVTKDKNKNRCSKGTLKVIEENGLKFELNLSDYTDLGLFVDHRNARRLIREWSDGKSVLNLFAYTGSFTCYAIAGGAKATTTVDLNKNYCDWAKRNMDLNFPNLGSSHRVIQDNCLRFIKLDAAKNRYDLIICDPPTFSNSKKMASSFNVDDDYVDLIKSCLKLLRSGGKLLFSCNSRKFKLDPEKFSEKVTIQEFSQKTIGEDFRGSTPHKSWLFSTKN